MKDSEKYERALVALVELEALEGDRVLPMINYLRERAAAARNQEESGQDSEPLTP